MTLYLASASPRRHELLGRTGRVFEVVVAHVDETPQPGEHAAELVERLAIAKATAGARAVDLQPGDQVIGADTVVTIDGEVLGKPRDEADAARMLRQLSGRDHEVYTGIAVHAGAGTRSDVVCTRVTFIALDDATIATYVAGGEPLDKAGAYAIQGQARRFVRAVDGSIDNVIGLPVAELEAMLSDA